MSRYKPKCLPWMPGTLSENSTSKSTSVLCANLYNVFILNDLNPYPAAEKSPNPVAPYCLPGGKRAVASLSWLQIFLRLISGFCVSINKKIPALMKALNADPNLLLPNGVWPGSIYDWVIFLRYDAQGHLETKKLIYEPDPLP
jgi:hypothetical protein